MTAIAIRIAEAIAPILEEMVNSTVDKTIERLGQTKTEKQKRYYTRQQTAAVLNVSASSIDRMARRGDLTPLHLPNTRGIRFDADELESKVVHQSRETYCIKKR